MTSSRPPVFLLACTVTASCFVACVGDDPTSSTTTPDASTSDVAPPDGGGGGDTGAPITDAGDAGPRCNPSAPFGPPEPIVELNEVASATVYPRPTIRGMYFGSDRQRRQRQATISRTSISGSRRGRARASARRAACSRRPPRDRTPPRPNRPTD